MRSEPPATWRRVPFEEAIDFQEGPGIMARDFRDEGVPLIRLAGVTANSLLEGCNFLDPAMVERRWAHFRLAEGDTLLSTSASLGQIARVGVGAVGAVAYTGLIRMRPRDGRVLPDYVQYLLASPMFQTQIEAMGAGSVMRHFGPTHLRQMSVELPPVDEQQRIASVSGALDEKIRSNRRLAKRLEETVRMVFRARLVDFVGTDMFDDSELGPIPEGWRVGGLYEFVDQVREATSGPSDLPYIGLEDMPRGSTVLGTWKANGPRGETWVFRRGDILLSKLRPYFRKVGVAAVDGRCSTEALVLRPRSSRLFVWSSGTWHHSGSSITASQCQQEPACHVLNGRSPGNTAFRRLRMTYCRSSTYWLLLRTTTSRHSFMNGAR